MAKEKSQIRASWVDLALPDEFPEPCVDGDRAEVKKDEGEDAHAGEEGTKDMPVKRSPKLLEMLRAAESRWTPPSRDGEEAEPSESGTLEPVTEALKTNMVSKDVSKHFYLTPEIRLHKKHESASAQAVNHFRRTGAGLCKCLTTLCNQSCRKETTAFTSLVTHVRSCSSMNQGFYTLMRSACSFTLRV